jgi:tetratricopeptide (TPR) repeat protein
MKKLIYLISLSIYLSASSLSVVKLKDEGLDVLHLSIKSKEFFKCSVENDYSLQDKIVCDLKYDNNISLDNNFTFFEFSIKDKKIYIYPKYEYKIFMDDMPIYDKNIFKNLKLIKKIDIVFYKKALTFFKESKKNGLNFNIEFPKNESLYIDVLNDNLVPIMSIKDVHKVDFIKKLYKKGDYTSVIKKANIELKNNNIYSSEILLYKIKSLDRLLENKNEIEYDYKDIENSCDIFIDRYPSHKDISQVLYYKIKSLFNRGKYKIAIKLTNDLSNNFPFDFFSEKASILKGKYLFFQKNKKNKSYKILKDILYNTKYPENALESAYLLIEHNLKDKNIQSAKIYFEKILKYDKNYFRNDYKNSYKLAQKFASLGDYKDASEIALIISKDMDDEELLKNLSYWQDKANLKDLAYKNYKKYLKKFPNGKYVDFVKERLDNVLLDIKDINKTKKIKDIDKIIKKYKKEPIYKKALIEKVKLFLSDKKYKSVLKLANQLKEINVTSYINEAAEKLLIEYLDKNDCINSIKLIDDYKVTVDSQRLYELAYCYFKTARYKDCLNLVKKYIVSSSFDNTLKWYYLGIQASFRLRDYTTSINLYEDIIKINDDKRIDLDIYFSVFYSYLRLKYIDKAMKILEKIENIEPKNPKLLDIYYELVKYYKNKKIDLSVVLYGKKLLKLQDKLKVDNYTPYIDILMITSLKNLNRYKEALSYFAKAYLSKKITDSQKGQLLYLAGELSMKINNLKQAKEFFTKCGLDVKNEMWQKLCSESLKLLEE